MAESYVMWGAVEVFILELDPEFKRDFIIGRSRRPPIISENGMPVYFPSEPIMQPGYEKFWPWHQRQAKEAVDAAVQKQPDAMGIVPQGTFYLVMKRVRLGDWGISNNPNNTTVWNEIALNEPYGYGEKKKIDPYNGNLIRRAVRLDRLRSIGSTENPFPELIEGLLRKLPHAWDGSYDEDEYDLFG